MIFLVFLEVLFSLWVIKRLALFEWTPAILILGSFILQMLAPMMPCLSCPTSRLHLRLEKISTEMEWCFGGGEQLSSRQNLHGSHEMTCSQTHWLQAATLDGRRPFNVVVAHQIISSHSSGALVHRMNFISLITHQLFFCGVLKMLDFFAWLIKNRMFLKSFLFWN